MSAVSNTGITKKSFSFHPKEWGICATNHATRHDGSKANQYRCSAFNLTSMSDFRDSAGRTGYPTSDAESDLAQHHCSEAKGNNCRRSLESLEVSSCLFRSQDLGLLSHDPGSLY